MGLDGLEELYVMALCTMDYILKQGQDLS